MALTVTVATAGIVAWIWSERRDDDEDEAGYDRPDDGTRPDWNRDGRSDYGRNPDGSVRTGPPPYAELRPGEAAYGTTGQQRQSEESGSYMARMSGALRRTPSPQQFFDGASKTVVAGMAAAGAVVGSALSSIREEDKNAYKDHETWSEEAESRRPGVSPGPPAPQPVVPGVLPTQRTPLHGNGPRKTVAIVVSANSHVEDLDDEEGFHEHAVCLFLLVS